MGGINTKEEIIERLDELDKEEIHINKQLRDLQLELNGIVPVKDRVKVKKEYFDDISMGELSKNIENQNNVDIEDIDGENLEDLENEEDYWENNKHKKKNKKKVKFEKENKILKKNNKKRKNK